MVVQYKFKGATTKGYGYGKEGNILNHEGSPEGMWAALRVRLATKKVRDPGICK